MKKFKMCIGIMLAMIMSMSVSMIAFAAGSAVGIDVEGYGFLFGSITADYDVTDGYIHAPTSIRTNPDNAYLKVKIELQNSKGKVLDSGIKTSDRGVDYLIGYFILGEDLDLTSFTDVHVAYGAHNVQGGASYPAQVVYTLTKQIP